MTRHIRLIGAPTDVGAGTRGASMGPEAFRVAGFTPNIAMKVGDIFSLMNLVSGGIGCTLLPGRVRGVIPNKVQLIPLQPRFLMRQHIALNFLRTRERDPNLLALASVCRLSRQALA